MKRLVLSLLLLGGLVFAEEGKGDVDVSKLMTETFSREMPIKNFCVDEKEKTKFEKAPLLNLTLSKTLGVSSKQAVNLICKHSKAFVVESVIPSDNDSDTGFDKFVFFLQQKDGCSFNAIIYKDKTGDTSLIIDEKEKCKLNPNDEFLSFIKKAIELNSKSIQSGEIQSDVAMKCCSPKGDCSGMADSIVDKCLAKGKEAARAQTGGLWRDFNRLINSTFSKAETKYRGNNISDSTIYEASSLLKNADMCSYNNLTVKLCK